jgi:hypothetical protein
LVASLGYFPRIQAPVLKSLAVGSKKTKQNKSGPIVAVLSFQEIFVVFCEQVVKWRKGVGVLVNYREHHLEKHPVEPRVKLVADFPTCSQVQNSGGHQNFELERKSGFVCDFQVWGGWDSNPVPIWDKIGIPISRTCS